MASQNKTTPQLLPVYLIAGEDELKQETVLKRLRARIGEVGDLSLDYDNFQAEQATGENIVAACNTLPLLGALRLVEVHNTEKLKKNDIDALVAYLSAPNPSTVLALCAEKMAKNSRIYKAVLQINPTAYIDCAPIARKNLNRAVLGMAQSHGVVFTEAAAATLIDLVGTNTVALDGNVQKIALGHRGSDPVNENEVLALVSRVAEIKPWEFVDAFAGRNITRALTLLRRMEHTSSYALLSMCVTRIRELLTVKALERRGTVSTLPKVLGLPDWRVSNHKRWAAQFSSRELIDALCNSREAEKLMKSTSREDEVFLRWVVTSLERRS